MGHARFDAAIVGGGPAGSALAIDLARAGWAVVLLEKERGAHDKVCGEFMSHEGADDLARLGVLSPELGAVPIASVRLARRGGAVEARLPFKAWSLSRRVLDEVLLKRAAAAGAEVRRGARAKSLERDSDGWAVHLHDGEAVAARHAILATGKHDLKDWKRPPGVQSDLIAFKSYWRLVPEQAAALAAAVELIVFPGGYAGLQPVEDGRANLCLVVRQSVYAACYGSWERLLAGMLGFSEHLNRRLQGASPVLAKPLAITRIPYGFVARASDGPWRVGDQAAVIPSFSGEGMSIALHSAKRAAFWLLKGRSAGEFQAALARDVSAQVGRATALSRLLVNSRGQALARYTAGVAAAILPMAARHTRISARALSSGGFAEEGVDILHAHRAFADGGGDALHRS